MPKALIHLQLLLVFVFFCNHRIAAQASEFSLSDFNKIYAGQEPWIGNNEFLNIFLDQIHYDDQPNQSQKIYFKVPVKFWVYTTKQNPKAIHKEVMELLGSLNHYHLTNKTGFEFYLFSEPEVMLSEGNESTGYFLEGPLSSIKNKETDALNIHLVEGLTKTKIFGKDRKVRATYNKITHSIFLERHGAITTLTHEMGHLFGLLHTHENANKGKCKQEPVSRTRTFEDCLQKGKMSERTGDNLSDTPADPGLTRYTSDQCKVLISQTDAFGDYYQPLPDNLMSYTRNLDCRSKFTRMQIAVMLYTAFEMNQSGWTAASGELFTRE